MCIPLTVEVRLHLWQRARHGPGATRGNRSETPMHRHHLCAAIMWERRCHAEADAEIPCRNITTAVDGVMDAGRLVDGGGRRARNHIPRRARAGPDDVDPDPRRRGSPGPPAHPEPPRMRMVGASKKIFHRVRKIFPPIVKKFNHVDLLRLRLVGPASDPTPLRGPVVCRDRRGVRRPPCPS